MNEQDNDADAARCVVDEIRAAFADVRALSNALGAQWNVTASMRAVMEYLDQHGATAVPGIARAKKHMRQYIQEIVDALLELDLVTLRDNPSHRRSPLIALNRRGRAVYRAMTEKEAILLREVAVSYNGRSLSTLALQLHAFRAAIDAVSKTEKA